VKIIRFIRIGCPLLFFLLTPLSLNPKEAEILLQPPGLRPIKDAALVIPAGYRYPNRSIALPRYRDAHGTPALGWSSKFVSTRRFASNQSAWIFFRKSDLHRSTVTEEVGSDQAFRFWPIGTTLVIEIFKGDASRRKNLKPIEIAVTTKARDSKNSSDTSFYPVNWSYNRFTAERTPSITATKVRECHQCHRIAFHLTGDLVFTQFQ